jgi:hypothetical protein
MRRQNFKMSGRRLLDIPLALWQSSIATDRFCRRDRARGRPCSGLAIARAILPAYSNCLMGQQHRVTVKRRRRKAYLERQKVAAAARAPRRTATAKTRAKKTTEKTAEKA